jgi:predicted MFS family arabinose efflux permease
MAAWAPLVPYAKLRLGIGEGALGLVLLSVGVGSIVATPIAGALAGRFGCRAVIIGSATLLCSALPFLATVADLPALALFQAPEHR